MDRFSCDQKPPIEVGSCEACSGTIYKYELYYCKSCPARIHAGCSKVCDICGLEGCKLCLREDDDGLLYCIKCHETKIENFIKRLSEPLADALQHFGYHFNDESQDDDWRVFEYDSDNAPRLQVRIDTNFKEE